MLASGIGFWVFGMVGGDVQSFSIFFEGELSLRAIQHWSFEVSYVFSFASTQITHESL